MYIRLAKLRHSPQLGLLESTLTSFALSLVISLSLALLLVGVCLALIVLESVLSSE